MSRWESLTPPANTEVGVAQQPARAVQGVEATAVAFPYGQMGIVMPIAISLALFANINMGFAPPQPSMKPEGGTVLLETASGLCRISKPQHECPEAGTDPLCPFSSQVP
jgi:hypothetical protein